MIRRKTKEERRVTNAKFIKYSYDSDFLYSFYFNVLIRLINNLSHITMTIFRYYNITVLHFL